MTQVSEAPPRPAEPARLAAVRRTSLLDTPPEEAFDRLTRLASRLLGTPISLISLVEQDRQFFVSAAGLPEPLATSRATPISYSFCRHVVDAGARLVVEDARRHPLVRTNPAVRELGWVAYAGVPLTDRTGQVLGALSVIDSMPRLWSERDLDLLQDLAAWAVTEIELRALSAPRPAPLLAEDFATRVFEEMAVPTAVMSIDGKCLQANKSFGYLLGKEPLELVGRPVEELTHPDDRAADREAVRLLLAGECHSYTAEKRVLGKAGEPTWVLATVTHVARSDGADDYFILSFEEPSARTPVALEAHDAVWDWDLLTDRIVWGHGAKGFAGYARDQLGRTAAWWYERLHPDERERVVGSIHGVVARGENVWSDEHRFRRADGSWAHVEVRGAVHRDAAGDAVRMIGATRDVSDRKRSELVLRCQSALLRDIASGMELDQLLRRIVSFTEAYSGGVAAVHLLGEDGGELRLAAAPNLPPAYAGTIEHIPLDNETGPWASAVRRREGVISPDIAADDLWDEWRDAALADELRAAWIAPLLDAGGEVLGTFTIFGREPHAPGADDARMVEIATDLARIAIARERSHAALRQGEDNLRHAAHRAASLTRQLLGLSSRPVVEPRVLSLNGLLSGLEGRIRRILGADLALDMALDAELWRVMADPSQIEQALVSLAVNARESTPTGGRVSIATANCLVGPDSPEHAGGVRRGSYATITVTDTGLGMDVAAQARIFEPFFTTKDAGSGTREGLSSVYGIVERSGGYVTVQSAPGRGATFTIYLPRVEPPARR